MAPQRTYFSFGFHGLHESTRVFSAGPHSLCATLTEQARHGRFVGQAELASRLKQPTENVVNVHLAQTRTPKPGQNRLTGTNQLMQRQVRHPVPPTPSSSINSSLRWCDANMESAAPHSPCSRPAEEPAGCRRPGRPCRSWWSLCRRLCASWCAGPRPRTAG